MPGEKVHVNGICLFCSDPRVPLWKNIKKQLIRPEERFVPIGILGGPISLANQEDLLRAFNFLMEQIYFALKNFSPVEEFLCVGHDCGFYSKIARKVDLQGKKDDVAKIHYFLEKQFHRKVRAYFGDGSRENFSFEGIAGDVFQSV